MYEICKVGTSAKCCIFGNIFGIYAKNVAESIPTKEINDALSRAGLVEASDPR